jgi:uncharacterized membrane protein
MTTKTRAEDRASRPVLRGRIIVYVFAAILALAGLADAVYLTIQALTGETAVCGNSPDCFKVLGSKYARVGRIPLAAFGALAYFSAFSFATFAAFDYARSDRFLRITIWLMFAVTAILLYLQAFVLHAFCRYCLLSAAIIFLLTGLIVATPSRRSIT